LEAPGIPVEFSYPSGDGMVHVHAESYVADLAKGVIRVNRVKVTDAKGVRVLSADSVEASGLKPLQLANQIVKVRVAGVEGRVTRLSSGLLDLTQDLPVSKGAAGKIPFDVVVERARVEIVDEMGAKPWRQWVDAARVNVAGVGQNWLASAVGTIEGVGTFPLRLQNDTDLGLMASTEAYGAEFAPIVSHFLSTPPLRNRTTNGLSFQSLLVDGPVQVSFRLPKTGETSKAIEYHVNGNFVARARGIRWRQYALDTATFKGVVGTLGGNGVVDATLGPNRIHFNGGAAWKKGFVAAGAVSVQSPNLNALPGYVRSQLPPKLGFQNANFDGWVSYALGGDYRAAGNARVGTVAYQDQTASTIATHVWLSPRDIVAQGITATYRGEPATGSVAIDPVNKGVAGVAYAKHLDLAAIARQFKVAGVTGKGEATALVSGTFKHPAVDIAAHGMAQYVQSHRTLGGAFDVRARYVENSLALTRAVLQGPFGLVTGSGSIGSAGALGIDLTGRNLRPSVFDPSVKGRANVVAHIDGEIKTPHLQGYLEGYDISYRDYLIPAVATDFSLDKYRAELSDMHATRGTTELTGDGTLSLSNQKLKAHLKVTGVQVPDLLGEQFSGIVSVPEIVVGGTLQLPIVGGTVIGQNIVAHGVKVDSLTAHVSSDGRIARLDDATAEVAGGSIGATGRFNLDRRQGSANVDIKGIALKDVVPKISTAADVEGALNGVGELTFTENGIASATASGRVRTVAVNDTTLGDGQWNVAFDGEKFTGAFQVGSLDRYVSLENVSFDPESKATSGHADLFNTRLSDIIAIATRYFPNLSYDALTALKSTTGNLDLSATFGGTIQMPQFDVPTLKATDLKYGDLPVGTLTASLSEAERKWDLKSFDLKGGAFVGTAKGTLDENGKTNLHASLRDVAVSDIGRFVPALAGQPGTVRLFTADATGDTAQPDVSATVDAFGLLLKPGQSQDRALRLSLVADASGPDKKLTLDGEYFYRGFQGSINGSTPFEFPARIPEGAMADATLTVAERDIKEIAELVGGIDPKLSEGTVKGSVHASGPLNDLTILGSVDLAAKTIAFEVPAADPKAPPTKIANSLRNVTSSFGLMGSKVQFKFDADSSSGGKIAADISTPIEDLQHLQTSYENRGIRAFLEHPLDGTVTATNLVARQDFPGKTFVAGTADGTINIKGTIGHPAISGHLDLTKVDSVIPTFAANQGTPEAPPIDPTFDVHVDLKDPARLRTSTADLTVLGSGDLGGSLAAPAIHGTLTTEKGTVRLPASTIRLEPDGQVNIKYESMNTGPVASVDVSMVGRTAVTALKYGDVYERYDITLNLSGDLLQDGGLKLQAESDPPDLSQDRILALLGQTDLLQSLNSTSTQSDTEKRLRDAFTSFALPTLTDPLTGRIARELGLDYLSVEYNAYELASVVFARTLGAGFTIQGRRQIGEPPPGFRPLYDLRVVYHPRRAKGILSRFSLSVGADQDREFKVSLEYGTKF